MRLPPLVASVLVAAAVLGAPPVGALSFYGITQYKRPNLRYGALALHPLYQATQVYDSNIYLAPRERPDEVKSSWITKNRLGLEAVLPWRRLHSLAAGYEAEAHSYTTQPRVNDTINQRAHLDYAYAGAYGLTYRLADEYENTMDQAFSELVERRRRWRNAVSTELDYDPVNGRAAWGVDASHTTHKYVGPEFGRRLNRYEQRAGVNLGWKVRPKTRLYASYHRAVTHYTVHREAPAEDRNSKSHDASVGVRGSLAPKITGQLEGGVSCREYDEDPPGDAERIARNFTVATSVVYRFSPSTEITLNASRRMQDSASDTSRFYVGTLGSLDALHRLPRKMSVGATATVGVNKYPDAASLGRRDDLYQGAARVVYAVQEWLSTGVDGLYRARRSTLPGLGYDDWQAGVNLALKF